MNHPIKHFNFYGLKVSSFTNDELKEFVIHKITHNEKAVLFGYSLGTFPYFKNHPEIAVYSNSFEVSVTDGRGFHYLVKAFGYPLLSDISIPYMTEMVLQIADKFHFSLMIIGSTEENNLNATLNTRIKYPGIKVFDGHYGGYFTEEDQKHTSEKINKVKPDILLIGVSSPKKEHFAYTWRDKLDVKIIIPFGGAIDILSGRSKPIPKIVKKLLLGALWRFIQEPRRLFRDSIVYSSSVLFKLLPTLFFNKYIKRNANFSIPKFYNKSFDILKK